MSWYELPHERLVETASLFRDRVKLGLSAEGTEIRCLITYIRVAMPRDGTRVVVLDLGGTRVRAAQVLFSHGRAVVDRGPLETLLPVERGVPLAQDRFFSVQADLVAQLSPASNAPIGYCFSYPTASRPDGDATLLNWTKEVNVPGMVGEAVGTLLLRALERRGVRCSSVTVINDTIASLMAGVGLGDPLSTIGLIVGTGTNLAAFFDVTAIPKFPVGLGWEGPVPVNLESGNFSPACLTEFDDAVDRASENPSAQRFEKAVSGVYLGRLLKAAHPELARFDPESGSKGVVELAKSGGNSRPARTARGILTRSAKLVAAAVAGLVSVMDTGPTIRLVAEGGLFWGAPGYSTTFEATATAILTALGHHGVKVSCLRIHSSNLVGAAIAAASRKQVNPR